MTFRHFLIIYVKKIVYATKIYNFVNSEKINCTPNLTI